MYCPSICIIPYPNYRTARRSACSSCPRARTPYMRPRPFPHPFPLSARRSAMKYIATIILLLASLDAAFAQTRIDALIRVDSVQRQFIVSIPTGVPPAAGYPLVFMFHGGRSALHQRRSQLRPVRVHSAAATRSSSTDESERLDGLRHRRPAVNPTQARS